MAQSSFGEALSRVRNYLSSPLEWTAAQIKARPKGALIVFVVLLVLARVF